MKTNKAVQPKAPDVSKKVWNTLYDRAYAYNTLAPWTTLTEDHIFAIQDPSGSIGYCSVFGSEGEFFGLTMYRGREGLEMHLKLKNGVLDPNDLEILTLYDALVVEFSSKKELDQEDLSVLKTLDPAFSKKKKHPSFRSYSPGFQGWYFTEKEAEFFTLALICAEKHVKQCKEDSSFTEIHSSGDCLLYTPTLKTDSEITWQTKEHTPGPLPKKELRQIPLNLEKIENLKGTKLYHDGAWEASIFSTPSVICDKTRPYFAKVSMLVHQESLLVLQVKAVELHSCPASALCEELLTSIEKHKRLPAEIFFNNEELYHSAKPLAKALGIQVTLSDFLPASAPAQESLLQYMK